MTEATGGGNGIRWALRSRAWFDDAANPDMTALYVERCLNYGLSLEEPQSQRPIIGIAQTGSDLTPCNRHHLVLAERVRDGIREAGGIPTGTRPTAALTAGKAGRRYRQGDAVAMAPQRFPGTPNRPGFGSARLAPGEAYRNSMTYRLSTGQRGAGG